MAGSDASDRVRDGITGTEAEEEDEDENVDENEYEGSSPTVSVVLPTYDRASVIGGAIESVLDQTYGDLELLVIDGNSTDGTPSVVRGFADDRVRYHRRESREGVSAARNAGIAAAEGDLVAFVDSDDRWREEKLQRQVAALERAPDSCGLVLSGITKPEGEPRTREGASGDIHDAVLCMDVPTYTSTLLVTREALDRFGRFDDRLACFEDWELCLRVTREYTARYVADPLVEKGTTGDNVSADPDRLVSAYRLLRREYDLPATTRAQLLADVGVTCCEAGRLREGRRHLWSALRLDPYRPTAAAALAAALSGSDDTFDAVMDRVYDAKRRLARTTG